jgi:hypothetical protein
MRFRLSRHAEEELQLRDISSAVITSVLERPEQTVPEHSGRTAYQSRVDFGEGRVLLVRAIVDTSVDPAVVVTVYRTSRIAKYWRSE